MKICCSCKKEKALAEFSWKNKSRGTISKECKSCHRTIRKRYYESNKSIEINRSIEANAKKKLWWIEFKSNLECAQCGENHIACLDFHHRNPSEKEFSVSKMIVAKGRASILREIEKCDVLCANCHRKHHYEERNAVVA